MIELMETTIAIIITILATTTAFYAIKTLIKLSKKKKTETITTLKITITLAALAFLLWTLAEITWTITEAMNLQVLPKIADTLWLIGYPLLIIAFSSLAIKLYSDEGQKTRAIGLLSTLAILATLAITLINQNCTAGEARCIDYTYSILSLTIFITIISSNTLIENIPSVSTPLTLIGISFFIDFLANITYAVTGITTKYILPLATADGLYAISYLMTTIAFYRLSRGKNE